MEDKPSPTRESVDFDHEFAVALFDELMDRAARGEMSEVDAIGQYTVAIVMQHQVDGSRSITPVQE